MKYAKRLLVIIKLRNYNRILNFIINKKTTADKLITVVITIREYRELSEIEIFSIKDSFDDGIKVTVLSS